MIGKITGVLAHKVPGEIIVDVGGVGYHIFIPLSVFYQLPEVGGRVTLYIHTHLREDALQLYGFLEPGEKQLFLFLNSVSGIGPKLALNILSGMPTDDLARALKEGDQLSLISIPGVGKRLAERLVVELRDRLVAFSPEEARGGDGTLLMRDAISALVNLGYRRGEAEKSVREITRRGEGTLEEVLKEALRKLSH